MQAEARASRTLPRKQEAVWSGNILIRKASRVSFTPSLSPLTGLCSDSQLQLP